MLSEVLTPLLAMEPEAKRPYKPRPSGGGKCIRDLTYHRLGIDPEAFEDRTLHIFRDGNWHEELTADLIRKTAFKLHSEQMSVTIPAPGLNKGGYGCSVCNERVASDTLHGHIDGIIQTLDGRELLYEHKALSFYQFERYTKILEAGEIPAPDEYYMAQLHLYLASDEIRKTGIDTAIFFVKCKNTSRMLDFVIPFNEAVAKAMIKKLQDVEEYGETRRIPARPYDRNIDWQCQYCAWSKHCYRDYDKELHGRKTEVVIDDPAILEAIKLSRIATAERLRWKKTEDTCKNDVRRWMSSNEIAEASVPDGATVRITLSDKAGFTVAAKSNVETMRITFPKKKKRKGGK